MSKTIRPLTEYEVSLMEPELRAYARGLAALNRIQRMIALLAGPGVDLDLDTMTLVANESADTVESPHTGD
jgi:hypothetical protein